jgi:predicted dehydrogenase
MLEVGIIGIASFYGPRFAQRAAERTDVDVAGVVPGTASDEELAELGRPTREEFTDEYDCQVYDDVAALAADVDAAVVATRLDRRADDAVTALEAGCPILTAKPASDGPEGGERIAAAAEETGLPALTTAPMRFDDAVQNVAQEIEDGTIGEVVRAEVHVQHDPVGADGIEANPESASDQGGTAYSMGVYAADTLLWLVDADPERVYAEYTNANTPHLDHPDSGTATVRFDDDTLGSMTMTLSTAIREWHQWEVEVVGTDGILTTQRTGYSGYQWTSSGEPGPEAFGRRLSPVLDRQFDALVDAATDGEVAGPDPLTVAEELALCQGWVESDAEGDSVPFQSP